MTCRANLALILPFHNRVVRAWSSSICDNKSANAGSAGPVFSTPAVADGVVYVGSHDGILYALDAESGEELWRIAAGGQGAPAVAEGVVYASGADGNLYAVDAETGEEVWAAEVPTGFSSPVVADEAVYVGGSDGVLYAVEVASGDELWTFEVEDSIASSPTVVDGLVYFGSGDDVFYAVGGEDASSG